MIKNGAAIIAATDFKYSHPKILFGNFLMNEISGSSLQEEKKIMGGGNLNSLPLYHGKKGKIITPEKLSFFGILNCSSNFFYTDQK